MVRQDQRLLLGQGHQPFGVSQLWVLGLSVALVWQDVLLQACQPVREALPLAVPSVWVLVLRQHPLTATMAVMCCRCQPRRCATVFLPFFTHTHCPTVVNYRKNPDSSSFQIWQGL